MPFNYFDNASTTKLDCRVLEEMLPYFTDLYGNASRNHSFGKISENAIEKSRKNVAQLINATPAEIIFTSGAIEYSTLAFRCLIKSLFKRNCKTLYSKRIR